LIPFPPLAAALVVGLSAPRAVVAAAPPDAKVVLTTDLPGYLVGRFGLQVEYLLTPNDGLAVMPFVVTSATSGPHGFLELEAGSTSVVQTRAEGLDFQYRRYLAKPGGRMTLFVAPGLELQHFTTDQTSICDEGVWLRLCPLTDPVEHQSWGYLGLSFDTGIQVRFPFGGVVMASFGLHYRGVLGSLDDSQMPWWWRVADGPGLRPRGRLSVGWAFN
jgi:hypothetical protein